MTRPVIDEHITFIYTENLEQSARFYEQMMSLTLWLDQGSCRIYRLSSSSFLGICKAIETSKGKIVAGDQSNIIITIVTPEVDEWYAYLRAKGVQLLSSPMINAHYKIYHFFVRDPNGYVIEIQRFLG